MLPLPQPETYDMALHEALVRAVPDPAKTILLATAYPSRLGAELKSRDEARCIIGVVPDAGAVDADRPGLDDVHEGELTTVLERLPPGSVDAAVVGDVLGQVADPDRLLQALHAVLPEGGQLVASVPNVGHHTVLKALLRGDFMYQPNGVLGVANLRFYSYATMTKLLFDAGFLPLLSDIVTAPAAERVQHAAAPLLSEFRVSPLRAARHVDAARYVFTGARRPSAATPPSPAVPISFVACVNDEAQLRSNLLASPCLAPGSPHEVLLMRGQPSAADGFNTALPRTRHDIVVFVQQDMYLPRGWDVEFAVRFRDAQERYSPLGVVGIYGMTYRTVPKIGIGRVVDRENLLDRPTPLPAAVDSIDEILLAMRRDAPLRFDPAVGFHLYGTDICLSASAQGRTNVVVDAPAFHNSLFAQLSPDFHRSREALLGKWTEIRPLMANVGELDTMVPKPEPTTWLQDLERRLRKQSEQIDRLRGELKTARAQVRQMRSSRWWQIGSAGKRLLRR